MTSLCNFCNKSFSTNYILIQHQKTAKYCLAIQNNLNISDEYICEFCNKKFNVKSVLKTHYLSCKIKKELDDKEELNKLVEKYEEQILQLKEQHKNDIELNNNKFKIEINNLSTTIEQLQKDNNKLENELEKYKNRFLSREEKLIDEIIKRPTVINNNNNKTTTQQHIINYNNTFDKMVDDLVPLTHEYLSNKIKQIKPGSIVYTHNLDNANSNIIDYNFACNLVNILKDNVFFTDVSRGKMVYKDGNNTVLRENAENFIREMMKLCKTDIYGVCQKCMTIVKENEESFTDQDLFKCKSGLRQFADCIIEGKPHAIITEIANRLAKNCKRIPSINEFKRMIKNSDETIIDEEY